MGHVIETSNFLSFDNIENNTIGNTTKVDCSIHSFLAEKSSDNSSDYFYDENTERRGYFWKS